MEYRVVSRRPFGEKEYVHVEVGSCSGLENYGPSSKNEVTFVTLNEECPVNDIREIITICKLMKYRYRGPPHPDDVVRHTNSYQLLHNMKSENSKEKSSGDGDGDDDGNPPPPPPPPNTSSSSSKGKEKKGATTCEEESPGGEDDDDDYYDDYYDNYDDDNYEDDTE